MDAVQDEPCFSAGTAAPGGRSQAPHPLLENQLRRCLARNAGPAGLGEAAQALAARPEGLSLLLRLVAQSYAEDDLYQDRAFAALDRSFEKAREHQREEAAHLRQVEVLTAERDHARSELARLRQALSVQERFAAMGSLASGLAQEIEAPIQSVSDNLYFLKEAFSDLRRHLGRGSESPAGQAPLEVPADLYYLNARIPAALRESMDGLERVAKLVRSVKEFSLDEAEGPAGADLNRLVEGTLTLCRNEWKFVAEMETKLSPAIPAIRCAQGEVRQALLNLVVNAAQAIEDRRLGDVLAPGGHIVVSTAPEVGWARICVADNGCGIPEEAAARIFEPFFTTKGQGRGIGQGLAFARAVAEKHKGRLSFETAPGHGSVFTLRLPI